jgi:hypothetical protein
MRTSRNNNLSGSARKRLSRFILPLTFCVHKTRRPIQLQVRNIMASSSPLPSLAALSGALPDAEGWTDEEVAAIKETKRLLLAGGLPPDKIAPLELSLCVMNCKLRPQKSVDKYKAWLAALETFGISSMQDVWLRQDVKERMQAEWSSTLNEEFSSYAGAGRDAQGRSIM